jgi:6,7-dimethyl-8-ribityllumazine synthase
MSGAGAPEILPAGNGRTVAIIAASWHEEIMNGLINGAERACAATGATGVLYRVPGTFELALAAQKAATAGYDAVIALGVVIRGDTPHFDYVCSAATDGLNRVALDTGVPVGFGLLTVDDEAQAVARAGVAGSKEDKGYEATVAALALLETVESIRL